MQKIVMDKNVALPLHELPGFRFHPTEEELLNFYLKRTAMGMNTCSTVITFLNIYHHHPSELPGLAKIKGEREWYFFVNRDRKNGHGGRPGRTTEHGFWKATGSDRNIRCLYDPKKILGLKKTLVFYSGRAPKGIKTDWIMNEYRLPDFYINNNNIIPPIKEDIVLCKIYRKATSLKILEQRAAAMDVHHQQNMIINNADHYPSLSSSPPSDEDSCTIDDPTITTDYDHLESWFNNTDTTTTSTIFIENFKLNNDDSPAPTDIPPSRPVDGASDIPLPHPVSGHDGASDIPPPPRTVSSHDGVVTMMHDMKEELQVVPAEAYTCTTGDPLVWMEQWSLYSNILDF